MSLTEIFNDSLKYPFSDMTKFCIIGIVMVVSSLGSLEIGNAIISSVLGIVAAVASIINANLSLDIFILSATGLIIGPTINEFA